jgi:carboxymethylenebutenolidase
MDVTASTTRIKTADGIVDCHVHHPAGPGPWPAVLFYMDGLGLRPALLAMAARLAASGHYVLLPNLYYRTPTFTPFDTATVWAGGPEKDRLMAMVRSADNTSIMRDTTAFLAFLSEQSAVASERIGCIGYCLGGRLALVAAAEFPERIAAAASIHGGSIATDKPDSPHLRAAKIRAQLYFGVAETDPSVTPEQREQLRAALESAGVRFELEVHPGTRHGFAVSDLPMYDHEAAERHWDRVLHLFREALAPA